MSYDPNVPDYVKVAQGSKAMVLVMGPLIMLSEAAHGVKDMMQGNEYWNDFTHAAEIGVAALAAVGVATAVEKFSQRSAESDA